MGKNKQNNNSKDSPKDMPEKTNPKNSFRTPRDASKILAWAVFLPTVSVVFLSVIPAVFPALLTRATSPLQGPVVMPEFVSPFQPGILAIPIIVINLIILVIGIAYYKKKECKYRPIISKIVNFEITKKQALAAVIILLAIFAALTAGTLSSEETWVDYAKVKARVHDWTISDFAHSFEPHVRYLLLSASLYIFGNIRVVPFITSMALLLATYFFTKKITQKRISGVVAMAILLQAQTFLEYSTTASYDNSWILLYLFALYLVQKFWPPSPVSFLVSIFSKALTIAFLPAMAYFIARSPIPKRSKIISLASYGVIAIVLAVGASIINTTISGENTPHDFFQFWEGFSSMAFQMRFDYIIMI
ncbi:MAG: hypothetical protein KGH76_06310, partial [Thaumarchaeota archaeon]|nr:hypothetical protein [Nitrososphaerota archaeon]